MAVSARNRVVQDFENWDDSFGAGRQGSRALRARQRMMKKLVWVILALVALFGWVTVYANVSALGNHRTMLMQQYSQEMRTNERLRAEWQRMISPERTAQPGPKQAMVYPSGCDEVKPASVATSGQTIR